MAVGGKVAAGPIPLGTADFMVHHIHAFTIHVTVLILLKGVLYARSSRLVPDKANLGFRFPCDGPGRGGTCQVSAWDHVFLGLFWMKDAPLALRPVIAIIELISYFVRPVSHSIRLAGNVMAGHAVIKVFAGFAAIAAISPVSILAITAIYGLEVLVAGIQAYVFTILTCVYLKDALHPAH